MGYYCNYTNRILILMLILVAQGPGSAPRAIKPPPAAPESSSAWQTSAQLSFRV